MSIKKDIREVNTLY